MTHDSSKASALSKAGQVQNGKKVVNIPDTKLPHWGEDMILFSTELHLPHYAKAMNYLEVYMVSRDEMMEIAAHFPDTYRKIRRPRSATIGAAVNSARQSTKAQTMTTVSKTFIVEDKKSPPANITYKRMLAKGRLQ